MKRYVGIIVLIIIAISVISVLAQPFTNLTERELLIQLYSKMDTIEKAVNKMVENSGVIQRNVIDLDKRVTKNETNIESFCKSVDQIMVKWNTLLGFFLTLLVAVIVTLIGRFINGKKVKA